MQNNIIYEDKVSLKKKTWIKTGGIVDFWITPTSLYQLESLVQYLYINNVEFEVVGHTSNLYFLNDYNPAIVISTIKLKEYSFLGDTITCDCGVPMSKLSKECVTRGIKGYSGFVNLPGTVAAAVCNNAGCFGCVTSDVIKSITVLQEDGKVVLMNRDLDFSHRSSIFKNKKIKGIILFVEFRCELSSNPDQEQELSDKASKSRKITQERSINNLGSTYATLGLKNNVRNLVCTIIYKILRKLKLCSSSKRILKIMLLYLYGYNNLDKYISDKNLNTFIWNDSKAPQMFLIYQQFMQSVHNSLKMEIEIKGQFPNKYDISSKNR